MLTVRELQQKREARAKVNHETYKFLLRQAQDRVRLRAENKCTDLLWQVPPLVPGRPIYTVSHAARYITDKLRRGGFEVTPAAPAPDVHVLYISWKAQPEAQRRSPAPRRPQQQHPAAPADGSGRRQQDRQQGRQQGRHPTAPTSSSSSGPTITVSMAEASRSIDRLKARLNMGR